MVIWPPHHPTQTRSAHGCQARTQQAILASHQEYSPASQAVSQVSLCHIPCAGSSLARGPALCMAPDTPSFPGFVGPACRSVEKDLLVLIFRGPFPGTSQACPPSLLSPFDGFRERQRMSWSAALGGPCHSDEWLQLRFPAGRDTPV